MRFLTAALLVAGLCASSAGALDVQKKGGSPTEWGLTKVGLTQELSGFTVTFSDGSSARYGRDGSFAFVHRPGTDPFTGTYRFGDGGEVCVSYHAGLKRCDTYVRDADGMALVHASGHRFPVERLVRH